MRVHNNTGTCCSDRNSYGACINGDRVKLTTSIIYISLYLKFKVDGFMFNWSLSVFSRKFLESPLFVPDTTASDIRVRWSHCSFFLSGRARLKQQQQPVPYTTFPLRYFSVEVFSRRFNIVNVSRGCKNVHRSLVKPDFSSEKYIDLFFLSLSKRLVFKTYCKCKTRAYNDLLGNVSLIIPVLRILRCKVIHASAVKRQFKGKLSFIKAWPFGL